MARSPMNIFRSALKLFTSNVASTLVTFLGITFFARELGASQLGVFFLYQALLGALTIVADFGLREAVEKRVSEVRGNQAIISSSIILKMIPIFLVSVAILLARDYVNEYVGAPIAVLLVVGVVIKEYTQLFLFILYGELRFTRIATIRFVRQSFWILLGTAFVLFGYGVLELIYSLLASYVLAFVWSFAERDTKFGRPSLEQMQSLFAFARHNFVSSIGAFANNWMDVLVIGFFLSPTFVAAYEIAWKITDFAMLLGRSIATTVFPQMSAWDIGEQREQIGVLASIAILPSLFFVIPAFFGAGLFGNQVLGILFGSEFVIAQTALATLMAATAVQSVHVILVRVAQAIDRPDITARISAVSVFTNVSLNIILVWQFGLIGAAVATGITFVVAVILHVRRLSPLVSFDFPMREVAWCVFASYVMTVILLGAQQVIHVSTLPELLMVVGFGAVIYFAAALGYGPVRTSFRTIWSRYDVKSEM